MLQLFFLKFLKSVIDWHNSGSVLNFLNVINSVTDWHTSATGYTYEFLEKFEPVRDLFIPNVHETFSKPLQLIMNVFQTLILIQEASCNVFKGINFKWPLSLNFKLQFEFFKSFSPYKILKLFLHQLSYHCKMFLSILRLLYLNCSFKENVTFLYLSWFKNKFIFIFVQNFYLITRYVVTCFAIESNVFSKCCKQKVVCFLVYVTIIVVAVLWKGHLN